ncbi:hypothetical protein [Thalassiella azotivora]
MRVQRARRRNEPDGVPDGVPVLSRGRHRSPRKGACFMELAGYLAGERWSDHPACTHPLLAGLARCVNDVTTDAGRWRLGALVPAVIGLTSDDPHVDPRLALLCARTALPVVSVERQRALAVGLLSCERRLAHLDGRDPGHLEPASRAALDAVPDAAVWAARFSRDVSPGTATGFHRHAAPRIVRCATQGIALACVPDPDAVLRDLLEAGIAEVRAWAAGPPVAVDEGSWADAVRLTRERVAG